MCARQAYVSFCALSSLLFLSLITYLNMLLQQGGGLPKKLHGYCGEKGGGGGKHSLHTHDPLSMYKWILWIRVKVYSKQCFLIHKVLEQN